MLQDVDSPKKQILVHLVARTLKKLRRTDNNRNESQVLSKWGLDENISASSNNTDHI